MMKTKKQKVQKSDACKMHVELDFKIIKTV